MSRTSPSGGRHSRPAHSAGRNGRSSRDTARNGRESGNARATRGGGHRAGLIILLSVVLVSLGFALLILYTKLLPARFFIPICVVLALVCLILAALLWSTKRRVRFGFGVAFSLLFTAVLLYGSYAMLTAVGMLNTVTGTRTEVSHVAVYVRQDDPAETLQDISDYTFGIMTVLDRDISEQAIAQINRTLKATVNTADCGGSMELIDALRQGNVGAIILNTAYLDLLKELEGYQTVMEEIREITKMDVTVHRDVPVTSTGDEPGDIILPGDGVFAVYVSGIDTYGSTFTTSRSDVNIIAVVNTNTHQVLLLSTPRDYFVPLSISNGIPDKLTHAGIYGVDCSRETLEMLYGIDIDYYFRLNFTGFENIVNAVGGVTVYSEYSFSAGGYYFYEGENTMDGAKALAFARERYSFASGDRQRGKNQMELIRAMIDKILSPSMLMNFGSLMDAMADSFQTSIPYDMIAELVRTQLDSGGGWNISTYSVDGTGDTQQPYSLSSPAYVMIPDQSTVDTAKDLIRRVCEGEILE